MERHCIYYVIWGSSLKTRNGFAGHVIRLLGFTAYSFTNPLRRGGPLCPPVPAGCPFGFGCWASRRVRLRPSPNTPLRPRPRPRIRFSRLSTNPLRRSGPLWPPETTEIAHRCIPTIDFPINLIAHLCRVTHHVHSIVCTISPNLQIMFHLVDRNRSNKLFQRLKYIQNAFLRNKSWRFLEVVSMIGHHQ